MQIPGQRQEKMKYAKSPAGQLAFNQRSASLSARQRTAFILFDGKRELDEVLASTAGIGVSEGDLQHLIDLGFVTAVESAAAHEVQQPPPSAEGAGEAAPSQQQRYQMAYPLATQLTAQLGLRGFRLNLAIEAATSYESLVKLYLKIAEAVGPEKARPLAQALGL